MRPPRLPRSPFLPPIARDPPSLVTSSILMRCTYVVVPAILAVLLASTLLSSLLAYNSISDCSNPCARCEIPGQPGCVWVCAERFLPSASSQTTSRTFPAPCTDFEQHSWDIGRSRSPARPFLSWLVFVCAPRAPCTYMPPVARVRGFGARENARHWLLKTRMVERM